MRIIFIILFMASSGLANAANPVFVTSDELEHLTGDFTLKKFDDDFYEVEYVPKTTYLASSYILPSGGGGSSYSGSVENKSTIKQEERSMFTIIGYAVAAVLFAAMYMALAFLALIIVAELITNYITRGKSCGWLSSKLPDGDWFMVSTLILVIVSTIYHLFSYFSSDDMTYMERSIENISMFCKQTAPFFGHTVTIGAAALILMVVGRKYYDMSEQIKSLTSKPVHKTAKKKTTKKKVAKKR